MSDPLSDPLHSLQRLRNFSCTSKRFTSFCRLKKMLKRFVVSGTTLVELESGNDLHNKHATGTRPPQSHLPAPLQIKCDVTIGSMYFYNISWALTCSVLVKLQVCSKREGFFYFRSLWFCYYQLYFLRTCSISWWWQSNWDGQWYAVSRLHFPVYIRGPFMCIKARVNESVMISLGPARREKEISVVYLKFSSDHDGFWKCFKERNCLIVSGNVHQGYYHMNYQET